MTREATLPSARPFRGKAQWGEVAAYLALAVAGALLAALVFAIAPAEVVAMRALAW